MLTNPQTKTILVRFQSLIALTVMVVGLSLMSDAFLTPENGTNILQQVSVNLCLSIGMTLVILAGGIDLSVGSVLAISGAVAAGLLKNGIEIPAANIMLEFTVEGAVVAGLLIGLVLGIHNGLMVTVLKIPPFVATLGMMSIARGAMMLFTQGHSISDLDERFEFIGDGSVCFLPVPVWIWGSLVLIFAVVTRKTRFGRSVYAVGGNEQAAHLSGLNVKRIKLTVYALAGLLAGVAGVLNTARLGTADPKAGIGWELDAIAAVVIGGTSLSGGRGTIFGTVIGCLIIGVLNNGLALMEVSPFWQLVIKGYVILLAVAIDQFNTRAG